MRFGIDLAGVSFLIVDDSAFVRKGVRAILRELGTSRVTEASDGASGLEAIAWERPDIIICDWLMRPLGGEDFMLRLRAHSETEIATLPVVMLTSFTGPHHVLAAARLGVNEFLGKPLQAAALCRAIERVIGDDRPFVRVPGYFGPAPRGARLDAQGLRAIARSMGEAETAENSAASNSAALELRRAG